MAERARCPVCGETVAVNKRGTLRKHYSWDGESSECYFKGFVGERKREEDRG